jgi:sugar-phosphatase
MLFDLDGVLVDSTLVVERHWLAWAKPYGLEAALTPLYMHGRRTIDTLHAIASHLPVDLDQEARQLELHEAQDTEGLHPVPGAMDLLQALPSHRWAIVTSGTRLMATSRLHAVHIPLPTTLITAEDVQQGKPHPQGYRTAATRLGWEPKDCLVIEDAPVGIQAAHAAGIRVIGLTTTLPASELTEADVIIPDLSHIHLELAEGGPLTLRLD